jgi:hypothetical protein
MLKWCNYLLDGKIIHLGDRNRFVKISNLVWGGKEIVTSLNSSLEGTETERDNLDRVK